jgi:hypothetical protein
VVSPNTLIYEERDLTPYIQSVKVGHFFVKATHADSDLDWHFSDANEGGVLHSVTQKADLSGRPGVRPGPVFTPGGSQGLTNEIAARYDIFRGPPPPGDWTLYIKFLGNESLQGEEIVNLAYNQNINLVETASLRIQCLDDYLLNRIEPSILDDWNWQVHPKWTLSVLEAGKGHKFSPRPFHQGPGFLDADSKIKAIDLVVKVEPQDVIGCSKVYAVVNMGSSWRVKKIFQFNQLELQMVYKGAYQNPEQFVKEGNNGTTNCANFCGSQIWGPDKGVGVCVGSEAEGQDFGCYKSAAEILGRTTYQKCTCQKINFETHHSQSQKNCHLKCLEQGKGLCLSAHRNNQPLSCTERVENQTCVCSTK